MRSLQAAVKRRARGCTLQLSAPIVWVRCPPIHPPTYPPHCPSPAHPSCSACMRLLSLRPSPLANEARESGGYSGTSTPSQAKPSYPWLTTLHSPAQAPALKAQMPLQPVAQCIPVRYFCEPACLLTTDQALCLLLLLFACCVRVNNRRLCPARAPFYLSFLRPSPCVCRAVCDSTAPADYCWAPPS